ncbi:hypothetical protein G9C85_14355 [Halorubellus sp. JP-L1]|uniref:hypothetical protein n=1 Tax=Halorubellus sp. JP-L1 TaxID=2715753 RepID=UPI00140CD231|nr:hypothetical protein [Halorubellus sp. JP-L1]NHN42802.1 hypothetical protein [Halorubellus sp. JP-L1]
MDVDHWRSTVTERANEDDRFATASEQFDGSVAFDVGDRTLWFKLYRGRIIDTERYVPFFGATFRVLGDPDAWATVAAEEASFTEQVRRGRLRITGNKLEANRMRDATELMMRYLPKPTEELDA